MSAANKYVPIKTEASINQRLLRMTGDKKRYGGGATRIIKKAQVNDLNQKLDHKA